MPWPITALTQFYSGERLDGRFINNFLHQTQHSGVSKYALSSTGNDFK
jgi:hypothetical protein